MITVDYNTSGQAATCLLAESEILPNISLFIASCDYETIYSNERWTKIVNDKSIDGAIWTFRFGSLLTKDPRAFAYCKINDDNSILEIVEKDIISDNPGDDPMALGSFWFRNGSDFIFAARNSIEKNNTINGEHYVANSINSLIKKVRDSSFLMLNPGYLLAILLSWIFFIIGKNILMITFISVFKIEE